eukprot:IDg7239t1
MAAKARGCKNQKKGMYLCCAWSYNSVDPVVGSEKNGTTLTTISETSTCGQKQERSQCALLLPSRPAEGEEKPAFGRPSCWQTGRRKAKYNLHKVHNAAKKLKFLYHAIKIQQVRNAALGRRNEILLFANDFGGSKSAEATEYFRLMQTEALIAAREKAMKRLIVNQFFGAVRAPNQEA